MILKVGIYLPPDIAPKADNQAHGRAETSVLRCFRYLSRARLDATENRAVKITEPIWMIFQSTDNTFSSQDALLCFNGLF
jgi:hypothetical protein